MEARSEKTVNTISLLIGIPIAIVLTVWATWITITAFIGGQAPYFFIDFNGFNPIRGIFWLVIVDPIVFTVAYWAFMLIMLPIAGIGAGAAALTQRTSNKNNA